MSLKYVLVSSRVSFESDVAAEKRGRPLGPTSREGLLSSAFRRRSRSWKSGTASPATAEKEVILG